MMEICTEVVKVTTTGEAGAATGSANSGVIHGLLLDMHVDFHASAPATTDITVAYADRGGNIWARSNSAADAFVAPRIKPVDNANAAITNAFDKFAMNGRVLVSLAECDALTDAVTVYLRYLKM